MTIGEVIDLSFLPEPAGQFLTLASTHPLEGSFKRYSFYRAAHPPQTGKT
jgi:hypothetical protein